MSNIWVTHECWYDTLVLTIINNDEPPFVTDENHEML